MAFAGDFTHLPNGTRIDKPQFLNAVFGCSFIHHAVKVETAVYIPLPHDAVRIAVEVEHLENVGELGLNTGFEVFPQIHIVQVQ